MPELDGCQSLMEGRLRHEVLLRVGCFVMHFESVNKLEHPSPGVKPRLLFRIRHSLGSSWTRSCTFDVVFRFLKSPRDTIDLGGRLGMV
jgi:hypothetical protein